VHRHQCHSQDLNLAGQVGQSLCFPDFEVGISVMTVGVLARI
jgi:hypothetical protein